MKISKYLFILFLAMGIIACGNNESTKTDSQDHSGVISNPEVVPDMHTSQISIDWPGIYKGTLPCADCEGIETTIVLNDNHTYMISRTYLKGEDSSTFEESGNFKWNKEGSAVTLESESGEDSQYKVGENRLYALDSDGNEVMGDLREYYILNKEL